MPDSARLVHAFHATAAGMGCACYFEYVRSAANVADLPSRVDLSGVEWDCGLPGAGLRSVPWRPCCRSSATGRTRTRTGCSARGDYEGEEPGAARGAASRT